MGKFFKKVGTGLVVLLLLPFMVVFFALFIVYSIPKFIVLWFIAISKFFIGERITDPLEIDRKAAGLFEKEQEAKKNSGQKDENGKFAGATINIYTNQNVDQPTKEVISHFNQPVTLKAQDFIEVATSDPNLITTNESLDKEENGND